MGNEKNETAYYYYYYLRPTGRPGQIETDGAGSLFIQTLARRPAVLRVAVARLSCDAVCFSFSRDQFIFMTSALRFPHFFRLIFQRFPTATITQYRRRVSKKKKEQNTTYAKAERTPLLPRVTTRTLFRAKAITKRSQRDPIGIGIARTRQAYYQARNRKISKTISRTPPKFRALASIIVYRRVTCSFLPYWVPYWFEIHYGSEKEKNIFVVREYISQKTICF